MELQKRLTLSSSWYGYTYYVKQYEIEGETMARGGINKVLVQNARQALLARGQSATIDSIRVELGNTGSKTTIHRYLKEIEEYDPRPQSSRERLSDELTLLIAGMVERLAEESCESLVQLQADHQVAKAVLESGWAQCKTELSTLQRQFDAQGAALVVQSEEAQTLHSALQTELTRNARLAQHCADLELRVVEKDAQVQSLEEKHLHARDALEHYRTAIKEQREQEQRRHEGQLQQVQVELRQMQQTLVVKQDELTRLNRDNERLLGEARQQAKALAQQDDQMQRLSAQVQGLQVAEAKAEGAKEQLQEQVGTLRDEVKGLAQAVDLAAVHADKLTSIVTELRLENSTLKEMAQAAMVQVSPGTP
jgi:chromosome segregation ATPase